MNLWGKSIISGISITGILFALISVNGWGPCAPGSTLGMIFSWLHYPATWAAEVLHKLTIPELPALFFACAAQWSLVIYAILQWRSSRGVSE